jgi:hypothetical protein
MKLSKKITRDDIHKLSLHVITNFRIPCYHAGKTEVFCLFSD